MFTFIKSLDAKTYGKIVMAVIVLTVIGFGIHMVSSVFSDMKGQVDVADTAYTQATTK